MFKNLAKVAFRNFRRHKAFSGINLFGLAIGMASCILISLWVADELSYDRFHDRVDRIYRLVTVESDDSETGFAEIGAPWGPALMQQYPEVENYVRFRYYGRTLVSNGHDQIYEENGLHADSSFFNVFSFAVIEGDPQSALTKPNSLVVTEEIARKYFGNENALGKTLTFDSKDRFEITAVIRNIPNNSHIKFDFLVPFSIYDRWDLHEWTVWNFHTYLLLSENADAAALEAKLPNFLANQIPEDQMPDEAFRLQKLTDIHLHSNLRDEFEANGDVTYVYVLAIIAIFVLLIACINFVNLTTARTANRLREIGIRKVVGSKRSQLIKQFLGESVFLCFLACVLAVGLTEFMIPYFNEFSSKDLSLNFSPTLVLGLIILTCLVGLAAGGYPAFFLSSFRPVIVLKGQTSIGSKSVLRKLLVVLQFTISIALIIATAVVYQQLAFMSNKKLGFNHDQVLVLRMSGSAVADKHESFRNEVLRHSNIVSVSATSNLLGGSDWGMPYDYEGRTGSDKYSARTLVVDENFITVHQIELIQGRNFSREFLTDVSAAYILNETAAKQLAWEDPIGKRFGRPLERDDDGNWAYETGKIIGVVKDFHFRSLHQKIQPMVLFYYPEWFAYLSVKLTPEHIAETIAFLEEKWQVFEPSRPFDYFFLNEAFDEMYRAENRLLKVFGIFAALAILIACLGLFGLAAFVAEQRTKEIGIRKVLGASVTGLVFLLTKDFAKFVLLAVCLAAPASYLLMNEWLTDFAYRTELNALIFVFAGGIAMFIAFVTVGYQAGKAALLNPAKTLSYE